MATVTMHNVSVDVPRGEKLAGPLRQAHLIQTPCNRGRCGGCAVRVVEAGDLSPASDREIRTLKVRGHDPGEWRLACMSTIGDADVVLK